MVTVKLEIHLLLLFILPNLRPINCCLYQTVYLSNDVAEG